MLGVIHNIKVLIKSDSDTIFVGQLPLPPDQLPEQGDKKISDFKYELHPILSPLAEKLPIKVKVKEN